MDNFYFPRRIFLLAIRLPKVYFILIFLFSSFLSSNAQTVFWTETFDGTVCAAGSGCDPSIVVWNRVSLGGEGASANRFYVSCQENGNAAGTCGTGCGTDQSLHIGNVASSSAAFLFCPTGDCGAAFDATGAAEVANTRCESPTVNCLGYSTITLNFNYIERGQALNDNASVWYYDGTSWSFLFETLKTVNTGCLGQGRWTASGAIALPASANNNPNVKIGFRWVNNGDGAGNDPSFAVDDITLSYLVVLPIDVVSFHATRINEKRVKLNWITLSETNNDFFTVEKSKDGENFIPVLIKDGFGNSNQIINYVDYDEMPSEEYIYYRLKQTDFNGQFSYSSIVKIADDPNSAYHLELFPNPAKTEITALLPIENSNEMEYQLLDIQGRVLVNGKSFDSNLVKISLNEIPEGIYFVIVNVEGEIYRERLIISR